MISFLHKKFPKETVESTHKKNTSHKQNSHAPAPRLSLADRHKLTQMEKLADRLERMRLGEYITGLNKTSRVVWLSFVSGIARGVGLTIGATLIIAIIFKIISALVSMNVPYLSDMMKDVQQTLENRYSETAPVSVRIQQHSDESHIRHRNRY